MSVSGMPGQPPGSKQGSFTDTGKTVAVAIIKRKVESMLTMKGGRNVLTTDTAKGGVLAAIGLLFATLAPVLQGDASFTDPDTIGGVIAAIGAVWYAIGARKAIEASGPPTPNQ